MITRHSAFTLGLPALLLCLLLAACGDSDASDPTPTATVTPSPSVAPPDPRAARQALDDLIAATVAGDVQAAWRAYAASIPGGTIREHRQEYGCLFDAFNVEFPRMKKMFARLSPLETIESYPIENTDVVEIALRAPDGSTYLATLRRVEPGEPYRVVFFNNGAPSRVPGAPDPLPSPDEPQGFCGIWTGGR
jgi:hypothetical protein